MEIGISILIFLAIGIVVMGLFCLVTRYFNNKLKKALEDQNEVYSMIEEIRNPRGSEDAIDEYQEYVKHRQNPNLNLTEEELMIETQEPKNQFSNDFYKASRLKRRLNGESQGLQIFPESATRSVNSLKSFRPQKIDSKRTMLSKRSNVSDFSDQMENKEEQNMIKKPRKSTKRDRQVTEHSYVSKLVSYTEDGVFITENNLISVKKEDSIQEKRTVKYSDMKPVNINFDNTLEAYGFEKDHFGAYKFVTKLEIPHMKENVNYPVDSLKSSENKQFIEFAEYYSIKEQIEV